MSQAEAPRREASHKAWLFGPDSMMWRVNRESVLLLGGRAALLMQLAHPLVAAAVADHSDFRSDPLRRLRRTLDSMLSMIFGDVETAERVARRINAIHDAVEGSSDGRRYLAKDPVLLLWVFSTLVDSSAKVYEACFGALGDEASARYYGEAKVMARMFGIDEPLLPSTVEELRASMRERIESGEVVVTPLARELAEPIVRPIRLLPRRVANSSAVITASLLPAPIREGYGLRVSRSGSAFLALGRQTSRLMIPLLPSQIRVWPAARSAG